MSLIQLTGVSPRLASLRETAEECISHHPAAIVTDDISTLQVELVLKVMDVVCHIRGSRAARLAR